MPMERHEAAPLLDTALESDLKAAKELRINGKLIEAEKIYKDILKTNPECGEAYLGLGKIAFARNDVIATAVHLRKARTFFPDDMEISLVLGLVLLGMSDADPALWNESKDTLEEVLRFQPDNLQALCGLGCVCLNMRDDARALTLFRRAVALAPDSANILCELANYYRLHFEWDPALHYFEKALALDPDNHFALFGKSVIRLQQREPDEAIELIEKAINRAPDNPAYMDAKSMYLLTAGNIKEGYEWAKKKEEQTVKGGILYAYPEKPIWVGEHIPHKQLMLVSRQGLGDAIQYLRYAEYCKERVDSVFAWVQPTLVRLFETCPYIDKAFDAPSRSDFDVQTYFHNLPWIFETSIETIPTHNIPYFLIPAELKHLWKQKITPHPQKINVGLVWEGSAFAMYNRGDILAKRRNMKLEQFMPLFDLEDVVFYSLQIGNPSEQINQLGLHDRLLNPMPDVRDMLDTAAIIENLDLVITIDSSLSHLAGALNKPVWILSRYDACWRWMYNRPDSPWYPTARIFGQTKMGDWDGVIADVKNALVKLLASRA